MAENGYNKGTMDLHSLIATAKANGASDLHLEPGLPAAMRIRGSLQGGGRADSGQDVAGCGAGAGWRGGLEGVSGTAFVRFVPGRFRGCAAGSMCCKLRAGWAWRSGC